MTVFSKYPKGGSTNGRVLSGPLSLHPRWWSTKVGVPGDMGEGGMGGGRMGCEGEVSPQCSRPIRCLRGDTRVSAPIK